MKAQYYLNEKVTIKNGEFSYYTGEIREILKTTSVSYEIALDAHKDSMKRVIVPQENLKPCQGYVKNTFVLGFLRFRFTQKSSLSLNIHEAGKIDFQLGPILIEYFNKVKRKSLRK